MTLCGAIDRFESESSIKFKVIHILSDRKSDFCYPIEIDRDQVLLRFRNISENRSKLLEIKCYKDKKYDPRFLK